MTHLIAVDGYAGDSGDIVLSWNLESTGDAITDLTNGVEILNLAGAAGSDQYFSINVPPGTDFLSVDIFSGTGDADLYIHYGDLPTQDIYTCRSNANGNIESCEFDSPDTGTWYVMVRGQQNFAGVSLVAGYDEGGEGVVVTPLPNNSPIPNLSGSTGSQQYFSIDVTAGFSLLYISTYGGSGDVDLYVRYGELPTLTTFDCQPGLAGNNENCTFENPQAGTWYIMLDSHSTYSDTTLIAKYYHQELSGTNLVDGILDNLSVSVSSLQQQVIAARLQQMLDAGTASNLQIALVLAANPQIRESVPAGSNVVLHLASVVDQVRGYSGP